METGTKSEPGLFGCIFPIMCLPFVVAMHYYLIGDFLESLRTNDFPFVYASDVNVETFEIEGQEGPEFRVRVKYHYRVAGQTYEGNQFRFGAGRTKHLGTSWKKEVAGLPQKVFYNPDQPSESALSAPTPLRESIPLVFLVALHGSLLACFIDPHAKTPTDSFPNQSDSLRFLASRSKIHIYLVHRKRFARQIMQAWACTVTCVVLASLLSGLFPDTMRICTMWGVCLFFWVRPFVSFKRSKITIDQARRLLHLTTDDDRQIPFSDITNCQVELGRNGKTATVAVHFRDPLKLNTGCSHVQCDCPSDAEWLAAKIGECMVPSVV